MRSIALGESMGWTQTAPRVDPRPRNRPTPSSDDAATLAFYESCAASYARETLAIAVSPRLAGFVRELPEGGKILDAGCGAGRDLAAFRRAGVGTVGVDRSIALAGIARIHSLAPVVVADLRNLPFADRSFAGIWASASLLHLQRDELAATLKGLGAILKPGGRLYATLKRGTGMSRRSDGRLFALYDEPNLRSLIADTDLHILGLAEERTGLSNDVVAAGDLWIEVLLAR